MDLVIVGVEASLWTAEQFAQDLKVSKADWPLLALQHSSPPSVQLVCMHENAVGMLHVSQQGAHAKSARVLHLAIST